MEELDAIRKQIEVCFNAGDGAALDRLSLVLNEVLADLSLKRALLGQPEPEPEQAEHLEMVNRDRLDKELGKEGLKIIELWSQATASPMENLHRPTAARRLPFYPRRM
jgi:hypothetical protein